MTNTGKKARKQHGNRYACKRSKARPKGRKEFGSLPVSAQRGNAAEFISSVPGIFERAARARVAKGFKREDNLPAW